MLTFGNGAKMIEEVSEFPNFTQVKDVYLDFETTSGDPKKSAVDPWHDTYAAGFAIAVDDCPHGYYFPMHHHYGRNIDPVAAQRWLWDVMRNCNRWINHNVKFDAHISNNAMGIPPMTPLVCTMTLAKVIDTTIHYRGGYSLDNLAKLWLGYDITKYENALQPYLGKKNKDYGRIPADIMAEYAGEDVLTTRRLFKYEEAQCPEQSRGVWDTEIELTRMLYEMEQYGMLVNTEELLKKELTIYDRLFQIDEELARLVGRSFRPNVNEDCFDVLCNQYGLPVLAWTDEDDDGEPAGNPSFDKHALMQYLVHPFAPQGVVALMLEYRNLNTLNNVFVKKYYEKQTGGLLHPSYNQSVRTGRMSCKQPNAQQLSPAAKELIHPQRCFISIDYSQIEFRLMMHYIKDDAAIAAYAANPDTDFHEFVASMCGIKRKPAKTINFLMGFGGGKERLLSALSANMDLVGDIASRVDKAIEEGKLPADQKKNAFEYLARQRAEGVFTKYHDTFPGIRRTSHEAARAAELRGYVFNLYGRRRHLPREKAHIAFNTLNQSSAADLMKERMVAVRRVLPDDMHVVASVHDEILIDAPVEAAHDPHVHASLLSVMEAPSVPLRVPVRCALGVSSNNWLQASKTAAAVKYERVTPFVNY